MDDQIMINELRASEIAQSIDDPVVRNLVMLGLAEARMHVVRTMQQTEEARKVTLPERPFDMQFFASVLVSMFGKRDVIQGVFNGQDLAQASGWDV
jgi:hypothetical protein